MTRYTIRTLTSDDFAPLAALETDVFGAMGEAVLCPHYLRLCTEIFSESCFIAEADGRPVGYLLSFVRGREVYCTTLAVIPEFQKTRVTVQLIGAFVRSIIDSCEACWFTVKEDNAPARALHKMLGATEVAASRTSMASATSASSRRSIERRSSACARSTSASGSCRRACRW